MLSPGARLHMTLRRPSPSTRTRENGWGAETSSHADRSTPSSRRLARASRPRASSPKRPTYRARQPSRAQAVMAVAAWPPGRSTKSVSGCLLSGTGYRPTTAIRSIVLRPKPTTSKPCGTTGPGAIGSSMNGSYQTGTATFDFRFLFAYHLAATASTVAQTSHESASLNRTGWLRAGRRYSGGQGATSHQATTGNPGLPERIHRTTRLCPESRRDRPALRSVFARHGAQAPDQSPGQGGHQTGVEPEPVRRTGPDANGRPSA